MRKMLLVIGAMLACATSALAATSVSYYGITWTFSSDRTTGTFANGEPWVVGPVTITNINPNPSTSPAGQVWNGSMKNPTANTKNGFDSRADLSYVTVDESAKINYSPALNLALSFPFTLISGDALVSAVSRDSLENTYGASLFQKVVVLTVLATAPPDGSFRPGFYGSDRTVKFNASQLNWPVLKNLPVVTYTPTKATILAKMPALPWFEWGVSANGSMFQPVDNTATNNSQYGRDIAIKFGEVGLWLNTNQPLEDKTAAAIQMVQYGLDIYSYLKNGGGFNADGGHKCGRKLPLVLAAMMLNDPELKTMAGDPTIFQEDQQVWFVNQSDVGRVVYTASPGDAWYGREFLQYRQEDVGMAEWGIGHFTAPFNDNRSWSATYRDVVGAGMRGPWLAAFLMEAQSVWNWPAAFAYMDRYYAEGIGQDFVAFMWRRYRNVAVQNSAANTATHDFNVGVYPNPMRDRAVFTLPENISGNAQVEIYDRDGRVVYNQNQSVARSSSRVLTWNSVDITGRPVVPGVYFYTVTLEGRQITGRIMVVPKEQSGR